MDFELDKSKRQFLAKVAVKHGFYSPVAMAVKTALASWGRV